jgi:hypothetical protein
MNKLADCLQANPTQQLEEYYISVGGIGLEAFNYIRQQPVYQHFFLFS